MSQSHQAGFERDVARLHDPERDQHFLAMDQSASTHWKHFDQFGIKLRDDADFAERARAARVMLATAPGLEKHFTGAIVHDDLYGLTDAEGVPLKNRLEEKGVVVIGKKLGFKKETGLATELDALPQDMAALVNIGVHVVKTRTTVKHGLDQYADDAAEQMVAVQRAAAKNGRIAAVLEPEFLKDNAGTLQQNEDLMVRVLSAIHRRIRGEGLQRHPYVIKTSFPTPGSQSGERIEPGASAEAFRRICERADLPPELLVVFLSGGHSSETSRELLQEMAKVRDNVGSSFSRANVERPYQRAFPDGRIDISAGQRAIGTEGIKNNLAMQDRYHSRFEHLSDEELEALSA